MSRPRIERRIGGVRVETTAILPGHRLAFSKVGRDGTGKCCFEKAGDGDRVRGVIFSIEGRQLHALDRAEGLGRGYERLDVRVLAEGETPTEVVTYVATELSPMLRPFSWYLKHVLYGAVAAELSRAYVAGISATPTVQDSTPSREARELSVYHHDDLNDKLGTICS